VPRCTPAPCNSPAEGVQVGRRPPADLKLLAAFYGLICSPALAEITGDGRPWTVSMISALSMPWR
jgi:hypothetical protein